MSLVSAGDGAPSQGGMEAPHVSGPILGFGITFMSGRFECGEVLNREGDVITLTGTVFAVVSSVAERIAKL